MGDNHWGSGVRERLSSWRLVALVGVVYVVSQTAIAIILHPLDSNLVLKLQMTFSPDEFKQIIQLWTDKNILGNYWSHFHLDFFHPFIYGIGMAAWLSASFDMNKVSERFSILVCVPLVAATFDIVENCFHVVFLLNDAFVTSPWVMISGAATNLKWGLALLSFALALVSTVSGLISTRRG